MVVECVDNIDVAGSLTLGATYKVIQQSGVMWTIIDDNGEIKTYHKIRFKEIEPPVYPLHKI